MVRLDRDTESRFHHHPVRKSSHTPSL